MEIERRRSPLKLCTRFPGMVRYAPSWQETPWQEILWQEILWQDKGFVTACVFPFASEML
jgi:hypothetical protein